VFSTCFVLPPYSTTPNTSVKFTSKSLYLSFFQLSNHLYLQSTFSLFLFFFIVRLHKINNKPVKTPNTMKTLCPVFFSKPSQSLTAIKNKLSQQKNKHSETSHTLSQRLFRSKDIFEGPQSVSSGLLSSQSYFRAFSDALRAKTPISQSI